MGRESACGAIWGDKKGNVALRLEGNALIVRGIVRATVPVRDMQNVHADGDVLRFRFGNDDVALNLGRADATRWAKAISTPPPSLAKKLGITPGLRVAVVGHIDDAALAEALAEGVTVRSDPALIVVRADDERAIETAMSEHGTSLRAGLSIWIVYRKGKDVPFNETAVRAFMRSQHLVDSKVAAVSEVLTGARFSIRQIALDDAAPAKRPAGAPRKRSADRRSIPKRSS
jgi:hypothetical protein